ncbi:MAG TPA: DoxX family protein [Rhodothermales bacterium]|nr:DoxX family protein [Rhodothermales bacterium]
MTSTTLPATSRPLPAWVVPTVITILRVAAGLMFMQHGAQKLFGVLGGVDGAGASVPLASLMGFGGVVEFFGGLLVALGLFTRPVAALAVVQMIAAYFMAHAPQGGLPVQNQGELALLYAAVFAALVGLGAGPWSLDAVLFDRKR